jgi:hypothetical protein
MSDKVRKQDDAMRRKQAGVGEDVTEHLTCESALREAGVDEPLIAKTLKEQLEAKQPRWNPKKQAFDLFPDYDARTAALRELVKIFGGYPSDNEERSGESNVYWINDSMPPKLPRSDDRERCQTDSKVSGPCER